MKKAFIMLSGLTALCPLVAEEMQPDTLRNIQLEEVVISATRAKQTTPISFSDIPEDVIKKNNFGRDIPYIIALTPSVTVTSDAGTGIGYTAFRVRGTDVNRINITINGIPYNDPESHGAFFVDLPDIASSLSSMQIQRGVGTSTNGAAAFGASVNMQTVTFRMIGKSKKGFNLLFVMVRFIVQNGHCPIQLFHKNQSYHFVSEGHFRKRHFFIGTIVHVFRKSIRASYNKNQTL
jgi:outer membrane cobalamin receptor